MSYQVLARKWRPQNFKQMVGQEHVLRALMNALDSDRLHHAYLFTGTRGVGKTTIARILSKCLNCETGVTSTPCGECNSCKEIAAGNFLDLIEVDAASRTKVEDTRELLENVQYAPTRARFKVYLIDEVHMLTGHSFNALLKTLEEPPPHVKFLFATTDPQKLPATILSRCLQFNLKRMPVDMLTGHIEYLLEQESIKSEPSSLRLLARAADGSMRDALSLLDQAIAFSGSNLTETAVRDMLGTISHEPLIDLLSLVIAGEGAALLKRIEDLSSVTPDFDAATDALISLLHQLAVQQVVPDAINDEESIRDLAGKITKEEVQLFYQIALQGRRDLPLSPDPRSGFEMMLLRMLSFRPLREGMELEASTLPSQSHSNIDSEISKKKTTELKQNLQENNEDKVIESTVAETIVDDKSIDSISDADLQDSSPSTNYSQNNVGTKTATNEVTRNTVTSDQSHHSQKEKNGFPNKEKQDVYNEKNIQNEEKSFHSEVPPWEDIPPELEAGYTSTNNENDKTKQENRAPETKESATVQKPATVVDSKSSDSTKPDSFSIESLILAETDISDVSKADIDLDNEIEQEQIVSDEPKTTVVASSSHESPNHQLKNNYQSSTKGDLNQPWYAVVPQLKLGGRANELIKNCLLASHENGIISLLLNKDSEDLLADTTREEIHSALMNFYGDNVRLDLQVAQASLPTSDNKENETPAQRAERKIIETQQRAELNIEEDLFVRELQSRFSAQIVPGSIKPKQVND